MLERARRLLAAQPGPGAAAQRATVLADLADLGDDPGSAETACALLEEALALRRSAMPGAGDAETARLLAKLGLAEAAAGAPARGVERCEAALTLLRRIGADDAEIARRSIEVGALRLALGEAAPARAAALEALCRLAGLELPAVEARAWLLLAAILAEAGAAEAAICCEKDVVDLFQGMRGGTPALDRAFLATREDAYRRLADDLMAAGRLAEAQQVLAMLREAELGDDTDGALPGATRCSRSVAERAARAEQAAARAAGTAALAGWLDRLQPALARRVPAAEPASVRPLAADERQLQFLLAGDAVRIILGGPAGQRLVATTPPPGEVHRRVLALRAAIDERSAAWRPHAEALHALLLGPVWPALAGSGVRRLILSPDGVLRHLPFALLHDGERHLVERFALTVAAGPAAPRPPSPAPRIAAFGLTRRIGRHPALPGVQAEIAALVRDAAQPDGLLPGEAWLDAAFTAEALRRALAASSPVLHIASHFVLRTARHEDSYLLLGDGTRLTLAELAGLDFGGVELLFLSACDTATARGALDGLGALARRRGAGAVIATLWPVRDHGSAALALDFYRHRFVEGRDAATALALAQRAVLGGDRPPPPGATRSLRDAEDDPAPGATGRRHPYHWAAHMLLA